MAAAGCACWAWRGRTFRAGRRCPASSTTSPSSSWAWSGFADPVRPTVPAAVAGVHAAGIRVVMITGDYPGTAQSIARQIGLAHADDGHHRPRAGRDERRGAAAARGDGQHLRPRRAEQKLRLVEALKANGEVVAMTGDGVNDAPALKAAHIGIAMGGRGTDVAREAAALVLLDDDFASIVQAVRLGRRIFDNLRKAMAYILAVHVPIAGMSLAAACCSAGRWCFCRSTSSSSS